MQSNLRQLSNDQLLDSARSAVKEERRAALEVLNHVRVIDERKLYLDRGSPSLFELCVKEFSYSNGAAQRRIQAMRLIKVLPEVQTKIATGEVTMTSAASIQSFLQNERREGAAYSKIEALELVDVCAGKSSREVEKELATRNPEFALRDSVRAVDADYMRVTFNVSDKLWRKFEQLKALRSHTRSLTSNEELLDWLVELGLDKVEPVRKAERAEARKKASSGIAESKIESRPKNLNGASEGYERPTPGVECSISRTEQAAPKTELLPAPDEAMRRQRRSRYIASRERHQMAPARKHGCGFIDPLTKRRCGSHHFLQLDHVVLFSEGGSNEAANLQWRCGEHNRFSYEKPLVRAPAREYESQPKIEFVVSTLDVRASTSSRARLTLVNRSSRASTKVEFSRSAFRRVTKVLSYP